METKLEKNVWILTIPIFIELAFFILMGSVDTLMISFYEKITPSAVGSVAAVGNASTVINLFGVLLNVVATGIGVVVSQYLGAKKQKEAKEAISSGILMQVFVGLFISLLLIFLGNLLFIVIETPVEIRTLSYDYLFYTAISLIFVSIGNAISAGLRSFGHAKKVMYTVIFANLGNVFFNYMFIFGRFGVNEMGVAGSAISTLIMRFIQLVILMFLLKRLIGVKPLKPTYNQEHSKKILRIGIPSALENMTYNLMQFVVLSFINKLGTQVISARTFVNTIMSYIFLFSGAFASGNAIVTGYYIGEGDYQGAYKNTLKTVLSTSVIVLVIVTVINLLSYQIASLLTEDKVVIQTIRNVLWVCFLLEIGRVLNLVVIQSLRATGDTLFPLIMAVISMLGLGIPFAYMFSNTLGLGLVGIYLGYSVDEMFRGVIMTVRWLKKSWMNRSLVEG